MNILTANDEIEVAGITTLAFVDNIMSSDWKELREKHDLVTIDESQWYPVQKIFNLFNDIVAQYGTQPFVAMGMKIVERSVFPPEMLNDELSLIQVLEGWQAHYEANHRGGDFPPVVTRKQADNHYQLILDAEHLYPFDLVYGMAYGFCKRLLPSNADFKVSYDETFNPYRNKDEQVIVDIKWDANSA